MGTFRSKLIKGTGYILISSIIMYVCGFFKSVIVARLLGEIYGSSEPYGIIAIFNNLQELIYTAAVLSLPVALVKFTAEYKVKNKHKMNDIISVSWTLIVIISIIASILYFILSEQIANYIYHQPILALLIRIGSFTIVFLSISTFGLAILQGFQEIKALAIRNSIVAILQIPVAFIFVWQFQIVGAALVFLFKAVVSVLILIGVLNSLFKKEGIKLKFKFNKKIFKDLFSFSTPVFLSGFVLLPAILIINSFIALYIGYEQTGYFRIAYLIRTIFISVPAVIAVPLLPMISELFVTNRKKVSIITPKLVRIVSLLMLPGIIGVGLAAKFLIPFIFGSIYTNAWLPTYLLLINAFVLSTTPITLTVFRSAGKTWSAFAFDFLFMIITISLGIFLGFSIGLSGIAIGFVLSSLIIFSLILIYFNRQFNMDFRSLILPIIISAIFIGLSFIVLGYISGITIIFADLILVGSLIGIEYLILTKDEKNIILEIIRKLKSKFKKSESSTSEEILEE